jgi:hypothetical protein
MKTNRYRSNKAANMIAVLFALGTAALITHSTSVTHWTTRHAHIVPQPQHRIVPMQQGPDVRETITPRPHARLRYA